MIIKPLLDLATLPFVPLLQKAELPEASGIYFAIDFLERVHYIGCSSNLRRRWRSHHRKRELEILENIRIAWIEIEDATLLKEFEQRLIRHFDPPLNWSNQAIYTKEEKDKEPKIETSTPEIDSERQYSLDFWARTMSIEVRDPDFLNWIKAQSLGSESLSQTGERILKSLFISEKEVTK